MFSDVLINICAHCSCSQTKTSMRFYLLITDCIDFLHKTNGTDCLARGLNKSANGVCYLWERNNNTGVYGIWNTTLARDEHNLKAILPAEDYL